MATNIPPHNLREVAEGAQWALANPGASQEELLNALMHLSPRLDDAYGEWRLRRWNPADPRVQELERQLRAPDPPLDSRGAPPALLPPSRQGLPAATP
jgi:hypothetical protein